jgi:hypothetical protein
MQRVSHMRSTFVDANSWIEYWEFGRDGLHINRSGARRLSQLYSRVCGFGGGGQNSTERLLLSTKSEGTPERTRKTITQEHRTLVWQTEGREEARTTQTERKREEVTSDEWVATRGAQRIEGNSLVLLQVNCRSIPNKSLDFLEFS